VTRAYVGLGANLGDRSAMLRAAVEALRREPALTVVAVSSISETDPVDYLDQPAFLNAAVALDTALTPRELLYGEEQVDESGLEVPHPRLHERLFALEPLLELDPALVLPGRGPLKEIVAGLQSP
jgi:2-amino-4-hydroxy-6-hydroxymethyldihydropteridine diphosphokinase